MANELELVRHVDAPIAYAPRAELTVEELVAQVSKIQQVMEAVMKEGDDGHYGVIPGTKKKTLYKAGAEKLCLLFRLDPQFESVESWDGAHLTVKSRCTLFHIGTGERRGSGEGSCSTKESKYAYRSGKRRCPQCDVEAIFKSKFPPRNRPKAEPGWYCWKDKGGCGANFDADDRSITEQQVTERVANPDLPDCYNTVLKMANKRALVAAVLNTTAASDLFTQDLEDLPPPAPKPRPEPLRPTEEQLRRSREEEPEPREPKPADLGEGFGTTSDAPPDYAAMGAPIRKAQVTMFKQRCEKRGDAIGCTALAVERGVLAQWRLSRIEELGQKIFNEACAAVAKFEPEFGAESEEEEGPDMYVEHEGKP